MAIPLKYNVRNLLVRKISTGMTVFVICLVVTVFLFVLSLWSGVTRTLSTNASDRNVVTMRVGSQAEMQSVVTRESAELIRALPGIERDGEGRPLVSPELLILVNVPKVDGKSTNIQVRGTSAIGMQLRPSIKLVDGRMFRPGTNEAVVSKVLPTRVASVRLGDTLKAGSYRWSIVGYFDASGSAYDSEIWTDVADLQAQSKRPIYSIVYVRAADSESAQRYIESVKGDQRLKF